MLCHAVLVGRDDSTCCSAKCSAMSRVILCCAMLRCAMPGRHLCCDVMSCGRPTAHAMLCHAVSCCVMLCHAVSCCAILRHAAPFMQALPLDNQPLKAANATKLSVWISEGIDSKLDRLLPPSHTMILWAAAVCRVTSVMVLSLQPSGLMKGVHVCRRRECMQPVHHRSFHVA
jgi:hypothetical protein